jgi:hypothetical protein
MATGLLLLAGCSSPSNADDVAQDKAQHRMIRRLEALPGAKVSASIESSVTQGSNNIGVQVRGPADATETELATVADRVERTIWRSRVDPLGRISINVTREGSPEPVMQRSYADEYDTTALRAKFGPRPDGLPG